MARFGQHRWAGDSLASGRKEGHVANERTGSLTSAATLTQTMERLVGIRRLIEELLRKQESLVLIAIGSTSAMVQRGYLLQVLEAEATGLEQMVRRLLPGKPEGEDSGAGT